MSSNLTKEDFIEAAKFTKEHLSDLPCEIQIELLKVYIRGVMGQKRNAQLEKNSHIRGWCLSPDFAREFISKNRDLLIKELFEEDEDA